MAKPRPSPFHLGPRTGERALDAGAVLLRVLIVYVSAIIVALVFLIGVHEVEIHWTFVGIIAVVGLAGLVAATRESWPPVLTAAWWAWGGNRGMDNESRAVIAQAFTDPKAIAFAQSHGEVRASVLWLPRGRGWVMLDARLVPVTPSSDPMTQDGYLITAPHIPIHPQQHMPERFPHDGWRGALAGWIFRDGTPLHLTTEPVALGSAHGRMAAMALFHTA